MLGANGEQKEHLRYVFRIVAERQNETDIIEVVLETGKKVRCKFRLDDRESGFALSTFKLLSHYAALHEGIVSM